MPKQPRYNMRLDFGQHGLNTTNPMTWAALRRVIVKELGSAKNPDCVKLEVTPAHIEGADPGGR